MSKYCKCRISSPSAHHNCCINDGCGKQIKTIYEKYSELKRQLKEAESVIEFYVHHDDVFGSHGFDISCEACTERPLGKCARQYLTKYKTNE